MPTDAPMSIMLYNRLLSYLRYIKQLPEGSHLTISSTIIAAALGIHDVQVRKDLAIVSGRGRPKVGYVTRDLLVDLEHFLGHDNYTDAVLVGAGNLGRAFLSYENLKQYGLKIIASFDTNPDLIGKSVGEIPILDARKIANLCQRLNIHIGIITVPSACAQEVLTQLVSGGVRAIWNFSPANLSAPPNIIIKNEDMAASLAMLTKRLAKQMAEEKRGEPRS